MVFNDSEKFYLEKRRFFKGQMFSCFWFGIDYGEEKRGGSQAAGAGLDLLCLL